MPRHSKILFLCTANYYRSRFAELYTQHLSDRWGLEVTADSAGLEMAKWREHNRGNLSPHAIGALESAGIEIKKPFREPKQFVPSTVSEGVRAIALCEREHRPMLLRDFPEMLDLTEFWTVEDVEFESPTEALGRIRELVTTCLANYL